MRLEVRFQLMVQCKRLFTSPVRAGISFRPRRHVLDDSVVSQVSGFVEPFTACLALTSSATSRCDPMKEAHLVRWRLFV